MKLRLLYLFLLCFNVTSFLFCAADSKQLALFSSLNKFRFAKSRVQPEAKEEKQNQTCSICTDVIIDSRALPCGHLSCNVPPNIRAPYAIECRTCRLDTINSALIKGGFPKVLIDTILDLEHIPPLQICLTPDVIIEIQMNEQEERGRKAREEEQQRLLESWEKNKQRKSRNKCLGELCKCVGWCLCWSGCVLVMFLPLLHWDGKI